MDVEGNEDNSTFVYLTSRRPCSSASDLDQWMVLPVVCDKSAFDQTSENDSPVIFLLAHVPTLKEVIFTHDVHEILARKHLDDQGANNEQSQLAAPSNSPTSPANELLAAFSMRATQLQSDDNKNLAEDHLSSINSGQPSVPSDNALDSFFHISAGVDGTTGIQLTQLGDTIGEYIETGLDQLQLHCFEGAEMQQQKKDVGSQNSKHLRAGMTQFLCNACGGNYKSRRHLYFHKRQLAVFFPTGAYNKTPMTCNICGKLLKNQSAFVKHRKSHLGATDLPYTCNVCTKGFRERCHLVAHYRNKHHEVDVAAAMKGHLAPEGRSDNSNNSNFKYMNAH